MFYNKKQAGVSPAKNKIAVAGLDCSNNQAPAKGKHTTNHNRKRRHDIPIVYTISHLFTRGAKSNLQEKTQFNMFTSYFTVKKQVLIPRIPTFFLFSYTLRSWRFRKAELVCISYSACLDMSQQWDDVLTRAFLFS